MTFIAVVALLYNSKVNYQISVFIENWSMCNCVLLITLQFLYKLVGPTIQAARLFCTNGWDYR